MKLLEIKLTLILAIFSIGLFAQPGGGNVDPEERMKRQVERLTAELNLSDGQVAKVEAANRELMEKMQKARAENQGDREAMRGLRREMADERDATFKAIFTPDQWAKYETFKAENRDRRPGPPPKGKKKKKKKKDDSEG